MPRDAEAWLAERGVRRERLTTDDEPDHATSAPPMTPRDAVRLAGQSERDAALRAADGSASLRAVGPALEDDVAEAVTFVRRSTSVTPQSEGRVRDKLRGRGHPPAVVDAAMVRARLERLVDDAAMAAAFVAERRARGHAVARIRRDLRGRGFADDTIDVALGGADQQDPEAVAFAFARQRAARLTGVPAETAHRRIVGFLVRRGHGEGLARKVAREAVFATRDAERTAGH